MPGQHETGEGCRKNLLLPVTHRTVDLALLPLRLLRYRLGDQGVADANRGQKTALSRAQNDIGIVDRQHSGIVGQSEDEPPMHQALSIRSHFSNRGQARRGTASCDNASRANPLR